MKGFVIWNLLFKVQEDTTIQATEKDNFDQKKVIAQQQNNRINVKKILAVINATYVVNKITITERINEERLLNKYYRAPTPERACRLNEY